jgi:hypothetical protein
VDNYNVALGTLQTPAKRNPDRGIRRSRLLAGRPLWQANKDPSMSSNNGRRAPGRPKFIFAVRTGAEQAMKGTSLPVVRKPKSQEAVCRFPDLHPGLSGPHDADLPLGASSCETRRRGAPVMP